MDTTTALTIIGSIGAASSAQIINHILTQKRDEKKYKKECLQNLYSPNIFNLIDYTKISGRNYSPYPIYKTTINTDVLFKHVLQNIGENLKYAEADLINAYQEVMSLETDVNNTQINDEFEETTDDDLLTLRMTLVNLFFTNYLEINKVLKQRSNSIHEKLIGPYFFSHFYLLVKQSFSLNEIPSEDILELYDLVEANLLPTNEFIKRIISIRKELYVVQYTPVYKDSYRVLSAYTEVYAFLYELADEFSYLSAARAGDWKEIMDDNLPNRES